MRTTILNLSFPFPTRPQITLLPVKSLLLFLSSSPANSLEENPLTPLPLPVAVARPVLHRRETILLKPRFEILKQYPYHNSRQSLHKAISYNMQTVVFACRTLNATLSNYLQFTHVVDTELISLSLCFTLTYKSSFLPVKNLLADSN